MEGGRIAEEVGLLIQVDTTAVSGIRKHMASFGSAWMKLEPATSPSQIRRH